MIRPTAFRDLNERFGRLLDEAGRPRHAVRRSIMLGTLFARDEGALQEQLAARQLTLDAALERALVVGTPAMWIEQLQAYAEAGAERVMLQWLEQDNLDDLEVIAQHVLPALTTG